MFHILTPSTRINHQLISKMLLNECGEYHNLIVDSKEHSSITVANFAIGPRTLPLVAVAASPGVAERFLSAGSGRSGGRVLGYFHPCGKLALERVVRQSSQGASVRLG